MADHRTVSGTIARLVVASGYGVIERGGVEYVFDRSAFESPTAFESLREGQTVRFEESSSSKRARARRVVTDEQR